MNQDIQVQIYPNPASESVHVDLRNLNSPCRELTLTDVQGRQVFSMQNPDTKEGLSIPVEKLASGIYMLQVKSDEGVLSRKITISR
jgi:hypothetical protein